MNLHTQYWGPRVALICLCKMPLRGIIWPIVGYPLRIAKHARKSIKFKGVLALSRGSFLGAYYLCVKPSVMAFCAAIIAPQIAAAQQF